LLTNGRGGRGPQKADGGLHPFGGQGVPLHVQFRVCRAAGGRRRETGDETVPHFYGFDVFLRTAAFQSGAETARIMEQ